LDPDNLDARDDLLEYYLQAPGFLGGGKDKARALVEEIRSSHPFEYRLQKALIASDARRFDEAESEIRSAIRLDPIRVGGYLALADYHAQHKQRSQAREVLRGLVKRTPDSAEAHFALGRFELEGDGDLETAVRELRLFLEIYSRGAPYLFEGYYWLGEAFLRQKQPEEALAAFQQALRLFPAHAPSLKGRAAARKLEREEKIGLL
jgi:tetratricopeptide (TPR) repeat protein